MAKLSDGSSMPFGKYKGTAMANVPASYIMWVYGSVSRTYASADVLDYIKDNLDALALEAKKQNHKLTEE